ncbi:hypothetical protein CDD80_5030 [Ophiocordyceps camponoti-rufipedis]|uniref:Extracellular membrane protein CFEM domain-containing protein n=1 Tax=Ophiocordyceps camponoti-rufipedis TaxID=2004952 RepID=A0A2C5YVH5_9HYPO|nr:hypothetical protein CDD80_5030 [Ophiocordyceps camponoti-rufipedis]
MKIAVILISSCAAVYATNGKLPFNPIPEPNENCRIACIDRPQITDEACGTREFCEVMDLTGDDREIVNSKIPRWKVFYDNSRACFDDHDPEPVNGEPPEVFPIPEVETGTDEDNCFGSNITAESCNTNNFCAAFDRVPPDLELFARWGFQNSEQCNAKLAGHIREYWSKYDYQHHR